jgi:hypothetical protein
MDRQALGEEAVAIGGKQMNKLVDAGDAAAAHRRSGKDDVIRLAAPGGNERHRRRNRLAHIDGQRAGEGVAPPVADFRDPGAQLLLQPVPLGGRDGDLVERDRDFRAGGFRPGAVACQQQ